MNTLPNVGGSVVDAADLRLPHGCSPWRNATRADGAATASACGAAWVAGRLLTDTELAVFISELAGSASHERRLEELLGLCRQLNGSWAFVVRWSDGEALAAVDRLRSVPLFYGRLQDGRLVLSCSAASLTDCSGASSVDNEASVEFLLSGYVMGSRTLHKGISQLQPGEVYYSGNGNASLHRYFRFLRTEPSDEGPEPLTETLHATMEEVFDRVVRQFAGQRIIVPLSGGLDSRLVLAMLKRHGHRDVVALNYGRPGSQEAAISRAVAGALDIPWDFIPYEDGAWRPLMSAPAMREFWHQAGQGAAVPHLQDYLALNRLRQRDPGLQAVFLPGYVGDMIAGAWTPSPSVTHPHRTGEPRPSLFGEGPVDLDAVCDWLLASKYYLWSAGKGEITEIERRIRSFFATVTFTAAHNSATAFDLFEFENRQARYIANAVRSMEFHGFGWWLPLCDNGLMDFFLTVPTDLRRLKRLYALWMRSHIFVKQMSRLAEIPPTGEGRYPWYGEPHAKRRVTLGQRARSLRMIYRSMEPRLLRGYRLGKELQRFSPPDLRFHEWFAADDAQARSLKLGDLMRGSEGLLSGMPPNLADHFRDREEYPLCLIYPLAILAASCLAEVYRSSGDTSCPSA